MASRTWRDLRNDETAPDLPFIPPNASRDEFGRPDVGAINPRLGALIEEQQRLNSEMKSIASPTSSLNSRDAARFQLASREDRIAEQQAWQRRREQSRDRNSSDLRPGAPPPGARRDPDPQEPGPPPVRGRELPPAGTEPRSALADGRDRSDSPELDLPWRRRPGLATRDDADLARFRDRSADRSGRLRDGVADRAPRLRDAVRELPSLRGAGATDRPLRIRDDLGRRLSDTVGRGEDAPRRARSAANDQLNRPRQKVKKLAEDWERRRDSVRGDLDQYGSYADDSKRVLSIVTGGSGNLQERAEKAIEKLAAQRAEEAEHEARRGRALESRRARREEER